MKRGTPPKKENTLFSYFSSTKKPAKKESMSTLIERTTASTAKTTAKTTTKPTNTTVTANLSSSSTVWKSISQSSNTIDLTEDDDLFILSPQGQFESTSQRRSFSFGRQGLPTPSVVLNPKKFEQLNSTSKLRNLSSKGTDYIREGLERGPMRCSQEPQLPQEKPVRFLHRVPLHKPLIKAKPDYSWLGKDDIKPYSSFYNPRTSATYESLGPSPEIIEVSNSRPSSQGRRGWSQSSSFNDNNYSQNSTTSSPSSSQNTRSSNGFSVQAKDTAWTSTKRRAASPSTKKTTNKKTRTQPKTMSDLIDADTPPAEFTPELSSEQQRVLDLVMQQGESLFFTGSAGTGKSVLLRAIIEKMKGIYGAEVAVTASTGIAACNINGCTLHSFGGIGIGNESAMTLARQVENSRNASRRWKKTKVLIIDEISMVDADLFDKLDVVARHVRGVPNQPFGGIQLVVTGDFFQLPPVNKDRASKFAFQSAAWKLAIQKTILLTKVFRQKDETFVKILNEMRLGRLSEEAINIFKTLSRVPEGINDIEPTELYPMRHEVDVSNQRRLAELGGPEHRFDAIDRGDQRKLLQCIAPPVLNLKLHAQVMLLKNIDMELVNGSIGVVIGFAGEGEYRQPNVCESLRTPQRKKESMMMGAIDAELNMKVPWPIVRFANNRELLIERDNWSVSVPGQNDTSTRYQLPLMLAWAISIHKSQGQTLDHVKVDLAKVFEKGQAYVALSRATSLERLQILNFEPQKVMAHPTVTEFYKSLQTI